MVRVLAKASVNNNCRGLETLGWLDVDVEVGLARTRGRGASDRIEQETIASKGAAGT